MKIILLILFCVSVYFFVGSILGTIFSVEYYSTHKKRLKQLKFSGDKFSSEDEQTIQFVEKVSAPAIKYILPKLKPRNTKELERDLKLSNWDKYFTATTYLGVNITLKILGFILLLILAPLSIPFALIWFVALFFLFGFLFNNSVSQKKLKLLHEFPEFIRITQGYLSANIPFVSSIEQSIRYVGNEWKPILQEFVINCKVKGTEEAIFLLKEDINIFEVRELLCLIKLNLEQGIDIKESFNAQADKVRDLQLELVQEKIAKRQMMCIAIQFPLLMTMMVSFGLPTFHAMLNLKGM